MDLSVSLDEGRVAAFHTALLRQAASGDSRVEAAWRESDRRRERDLREKNRRKWADYYRRLSIVFSERAQEHAERAAALEGGSR